MVTKRMLVNEEIAVLLSEMTFGEIGVEIGVTESTVRDWYKGTRKVHYLVGQKLKSMAKKVKAKQGA